MQAGTSFTVGHTIATERDRYELLSELGRGGMGIVFKASELSLDRVVAIKTFQDSFDQIALQRFVQEAKLLAHLNHPNIVRVYSTHVHQGCPFVVMEYVEGAPLNELLRDRQTLTLPDFYSIFGDLLSALEYLHEQGVVHRDVKPSNILVTTDGIAKLTDFGIAKDITSSQMQKMTQTGAMLGSPAYMSPEQCRSEAVDARSDLYSLACTMYEALAGKPPFIGDSVFDVMYQHINSDTQTLGDLADAALSNVLAKALQKDPADRFATAGEFREALQKAQAGEITVPRRTRGRRGSGPSVKRAGIITLTVTLCAGLAYYCYMNQALLFPNREPEEVSERIIKRFIKTREDHILNPAEVSEWTAKLEEILKRTDSIKVQYTRAGLRYDLAVHLAGLYPRTEKQKLLAMYRLAFTELPKAFPRGENQLRYMDRLNCMRLCGLYDESWEMVAQFESEAERNHYPTGKAFAALHRGRVRAAQQRPAEALPILQRALTEYQAAESDSISVEHLTAYNALVKVLADLDRRPEAEQLTAQAFQLTSKIPLPWDPSVNLKYQEELRMLAYQGMDRCITAVDYPGFKRYEGRYQKTISEINDPSLVSVSENQLRDVQVRMATALFLSGKLPESYQLSKRLVALPADNPLQMADRVAAYTVLGASAQNMHKWQEAIDAAHALQAHRGEVGDLRYDTMFRAERMLAVAHAHLRHNDEARKHFKLAADALEHATGRSFEAERKALELERLAFERGELN